MIKSGHPKEHLRPFEPWTEAGGAGPVATELEAIALAMEALVLEPAVQGLQPEGLVLFERPLVVEEEAVWAEHSP
tara:strand:- start:23 stop:247 length:225 start_codon:yes stop_codon:yes gene_type:complete